MVEQAVDEMLHLKIANALLDHDPPQTLVLLTGDGKQSSFGISFPDPVRQAAKRKWSVVVWSWRDQLSAAFAHLVRQGVQGLLVKHLDPHYKKITFIKGGSYRVGASSFCTIHERVVERFP
jgi:hypothetical protein